jgi:predicted MFS family arabinose efflux permease
MLKATVKLYKNSYSGLTKRIWLLGTVMLINRSGTMVLAFMTLYCKHLGYSIQQGGWVVAVYGIGAVVGAFLGGKISDKFGFYYTQFGALFLGGILFIVLGQMETYESICICTFFLSMVNESFRPANATAVAHYSDASTRTQSFSLVRLAINLGWGVGSAAGGILASIDYHLLFWADGITNLAAAGLLLALLPKVSVQQQKTFTRVSSREKKVVSPYRDRIFIYFLGLQVLFALCFFQLFTTIPIYFKQGLQMSEFWIGVTMAVNGLLIAVFEMVLVFKLEGRRPYLVFMCMGTILMAVSFLCLNLPVLPGIIIGFAFVIIITFAEMIAMPFMNSYYIARSSDENRGIYAGLYTMAWSIAQVIGSSSGSSLAFHLGFANLWYIISAICLLAAIGYYRLQMKK